MGFKPAQFRPMASSNETYGQSTRVRAYCRILRHCYRTLFYPKAVSTWPPYYIDSAGDISTTVPHGRGGGRLSASRQGEYLSLKAAQIFIEAAGLTQSIGSHHSLCDHQLELGGRARQRSGKGDCSVHQANERLDSQARQANPVGMGPGKRPKRSLTRSHSNCLPSRHSYWANVAALDQRDNWQTQCSVSELA